MLELCNITRSVEINHVVIIDILSQGHCCNLSFWIAGFLGVSVMNFCRPLAKL